MNRSPLSLENFLSFARASLLPKVKISHALSIIITGDCLAVPLVKKNL